MRWKKTSKNEREIVPTVDLLLKVFMCRTKGLLQSAYSILLLLALWAFSCYSGLLCGASTFVRRDGQQIDSANN